MDDKTSQFVVGDKKFDLILSKLPCFHDACEVLLSPVLPNDFILAEDYIKSFPNHSLFIDDNGKPEMAADLLTPACCYSLFHYLMGQRFQNEKIFTIKSFVFRNELAYQSWSRERAFLVRDYVYIGKKEQVEEWLGKVQKEITNLFNSLNLEIIWKPATDTFFDQRSFEFKIQAALELKREAVVNELAIGSLNNHINSFGRKCNISAENEAAFSACFGLGYHRAWHVLVERHGVDKAISLLNSI